VRGDIYSRAMPTVRLRDGRTVEYGEFGEPDGKPVVYLPGTPDLYGGAMVGDAPAGAAGVRLVAICRPGYGASSLTPPGLASVGRDVDELMARLGVGAYAVHGVSGGGPFALACAAVAPERVRAVVASGSPAPWSIADPDQLTEREHAAVAALDRGEVEAAWTFMAADCQDLVDVASVQGPVEFGRNVAEPLLGETFARLHPEDYAVFVRGMHAALVAGVDGFVRDNLSWISHWDIELSAVKAPVQLVHGNRDVVVGTVHGDWLGKRLPDVECLVLDDADHGGTCLGDAGRVYTRLADALS